MRQTPFLLLLLCLSCSSSGEPSAQEKIRVFVGIPPQAFFVRRIGGDRVAVEVLVRPGASPHTFEPTPKQISSLASADIFFSIGLPFEKHLVQKLERGIEHLRIVDTTHGVAFRKSTGSEEHPDPHIWLNPLLVKTIASNICEVLQKLDPAFSELYAENLTVFCRDLDSLYERTKALLAPYAGREFLVFHPAFGHFAAAFDLKQIAIEKEGKEPGGRHLASLIEYAKKKRLKVLFVQPQFSDRTARTVAESIQAEIVPLDALAYDYIHNMETIALRIRDSFEKQ